LIHHTADLSDEELDKLERGIPRLVSQATSDAYDRALAGGLSVVRVQDGFLVETSAAGGTSILAVAPSRCRVSVGHRFTVRRLSDS